MVILSVQISVSLSVLKGWGLHPVDDIATLAEVLGQFKGGTLCMCGWSANLESKLLAVFCSLRRLLLATLLFEISFNWRIIGDFGIT